jgi:hypothetical protein
MLPRVTLNPIKDLRLNLTLVVKKELEILVHFGCGGRWNLIISIKRFLNQIMLLNRKGGQLNFILKEIL